MTPFRIEFIMKKEEKIGRIVLTTIIILVMIVLAITQSHIGIVMAIFQVILLVVVGYSIGPVVANILGIKSGELFIGSKRHIDIPMLSKAETLAKRYEFEKSAELYREIQEQFPDHLPLYHPLFEILINRLKDRETARLVYRTGWMAMKEDKRKSLEHLFHEFDIK
jgi:hypothetical protein